MKLGIIADDFTGATDIASMLVRGGLPTVQLIGVPGANTPVDPAAQAVVVALKSRTIAAEQAVAQSLAALAWLQAQGATRFIFKVCSTFDSTPQGNIGPVAEALMQALGSGQCVVCPAYPENGRSVFKGHLFVGDSLLSDSGMRDHPLTPMTDASLVRVMQAQSRQRVGLLAREVVAQGPQAITEGLARLWQQGTAHVVADAIDNTDLLALAQGCAHLPLWVAGSGLALGLPALLASQDGVALQAGADRLQAPGSSRAAVLAGSCSVATRGQVARWQAAGRPARALDVLGLAAGRPVVQEALQWAVSQADAPLLYATAEPDALRAVQAALGVEAAGALVESAMGQLARGLVEAGVRRLVVAGGETSGAVVQALAVQALRIGAAICPGVPWTEALGRSGTDTLHLALKSGNFGSPDFFAEALA